METMDEIHPYWGGVHRAWARFQRCEPFSLID